MEKTREDEIIKALLRYSWQEAPTWGDLTARERMLLSEEEFLGLRRWAFGGDE